ncbi:DUF4399 domain-containing protein [Candidatus Reidiella endopervernicosa]|uniref:DUF4399 domain-containing protein n=1 Tax=Candidatus Reidiella endopervernicosa TaxID=2738883 RepID=A0A6N0HS99_9GAMM|nr:DUF4399 domain-containing protein [Candidatus Reidiella endopervernicosa]QKQ25204.1 DUF4399 domain-containing protein [Candidatus Reidiella endopervernicosa]
MSLKPFVAVVALAGLIISLASAADQTPSPEGAQVYIISPANGERVSSPVTVKFGLQGMGVAPAGVEKAKTGHHHLLVDVMDLPALDRPLPSDANHKHFGGGQTETTIELSAGRHTLQLIVGDKSHIPHQPPVVSEKITVHVR